MFRKNYLYVMISTFILVAGCSAANNVDNSGEEKPVDNSVQVAEDDYEQIIEPNNKLGFALLSKVDSDENDNIFISPMSAVMALSMVLNGAEGETKDEITEALALKNISVEDISRANASLMDRLETDSETLQLSIANSIWLNEEFQFTDEFAKNTMNYFQAETIEIDVNNDKSVDMINDWVNEATNHKIKEITEAPLDSNLVAMLINALYFKGEWQFEFDKELTEELPFYSQESESNVPMMMLEEELMYMDGDNFQAVKLPYGKGEMSMSVFLPSESSDMESFIEELTMDNWQEWQTAFQEMKGIVKLPKFQIEYETELNDALQQLGMEQAFNPEKANFSEMIYGDDPLWIDVVKQKTYIDVNEEGTEAAAVTSVEIKTTSLVVEDTFTMEVNRPFFLTITDDETDAILFMGIISNPEQGM